MNKAALIAMKHIGAFCQEITREYKAALEPEHRAAPRLFEGKCKNEGRWVWKTEDENPRGCKEMYPEPEPEPELDADGKVWDKRIHSSGGTRYKTGKNAGLWVWKRGVTEEEIAQVYDELYPEGAPEQEQEQEQGLTWAGLIERVTAAAIAPDVAIAACKKHGFEHLGALQDSPGMIPVVAQELGV